MVIPAQGLLGKAMKLGAEVCCQDVNADGCLVGAAVDAQALVGVAGQRAFDGSWADPQAAAGHGLIQDGVPDGTDEVDDCAGDDPGGLDDLVAGGLDGDAEAGPVGVGAGDGGGGVGNSDPDHLVEGGQCADLLGDAGQG